MARRLMLLAVISAVLGLGLGSCGGSSRKFTQQDIIKALQLNRLGGEYAMPGTFCQVTGFYTSSGEISDASQGAAKKRVISSKQGNVGIRIMPPFSRQCGKSAVAGLNKLDHPKKNE